MRAAGRCSPRCVSGSLPEVVAAALGAGVAAAREVPGGDINAALRIDLDDGRALFVKHRRNGNFATEAAGLRWLAEPAALPLPAPLAWDDDWLALEWLDSAPRGPGFEDALGRGLAQLHAAGADAFAGPMLVGDVRLEGEPAPDWPTFYGERRLAPLARMAGIDLDRLIARLGELCGPPEPPARLHGDLWSGNVMSGPGGEPWLVDPAAYGGHREIDLAMLQLFGSPPPSFFAAYQEVAPLADGWRERVELNQLLPLLIHAVLFGGGYGAAVARAAARYV
jgi:fructosamine-3-kinase